MRWMRRTLLALALVAASAPLGSALETLSIGIGPGTTELQYAGYDVRVETTGDVIVYLSIEDGEVVGRVDALPGTAGATVTITVIADPDRVIFEGRVVAPTVFSDYLPQETGRGEQ